MEKRFVTFLLVALVVLVGYQYLMFAVFGPPPKRPAAVLPDEQRAHLDPEDARDADKVREAAQAELADATAVPAAKPQEEASSNEASSNDVAELQPDEGVAEQEQTNEQSGPMQYATLGSLKKGDGYEMLVVFCSQGASIHSLQLANPKYRDLDRSHGYLGELALTSVKEGCEVQVVGEGTPAAEAGLRGPVFTEKEGKVSIKKPGDIVTSINGMQIELPSDLDSELMRTQPGQKIEIAILRDGRSMTLSAKLSEIPLRLIQREPVGATSDQPADPMSYLVTLCQIGPQKVRFGENEIKGLPSLYNRNWSLRNLPATDDQDVGIEFATTLTTSDLEPLGLKGPIELVKRFRLAKEKKGAERHHAEAYQLLFEIEILNGADSDQQLAYQIDGPTGITTEGWWYLYKTHPSRFAAAGARDVAWREASGRHELFVCSEITKNAKDNPDNPNMAMADSDQKIQMRYVGCDTQYFAAVMMPREGNPRATQMERQPLLTTDEFASAVARAVGSPDEKLKRTNVSYRLQSRLFNVAAKDKLFRGYTLFVGPKQNQVLEHYALGDFVTYGWFGKVSKPLLGLLHGLYWITGGFSYGLAIVLLTVLVRGCMFPFGVQMAKNAQKMQMLAPEMKKIAETYKNDMEKRASAQKELFAKHKYNPFSGCVVMFLQMPIFLGLYRGLSCDIELRQAPLIPGLNWCSNLAGPDMFWHWENVVPPIISNTSGLLGLGPYLNILPLFAVGLFLVQQKMFTPPPQDEQQAMQHQIMKFMMVFMGLIFHKVAAGLCLYIITSTLWGICEKLMLPKPAVAGATTTAAVPVTASANSNGTASDAKAKRRKNKRR